MGYKRKKVGMVDLIKKRLFIFLGIVLVLAVFAVHYAAADCCLILGNGCYNYDTNTCKSNNGMSLPINQCPDITPPVTGTDQYIKMCSYSCCCSINDNISIYGKNPINQNETKCISDGGKFIYGLDKSASCDVICGNQQKYTLNISVNDTAGNPINGATITVTSNPRQGSTNSITPTGGGNYSITDLPLGTSIIQVSKKECQTSTQDKQITGQDTPTLYVTLNCTPCSLVEWPCTGTAYSGTATMSCHGETISQTVQCTPPDTAPKCNDGIFEKGEWCEKIGNNIVNNCPINPYDSTGAKYVCNVNDCTKCIVPNNQKLPTCGNGKKESGEQCDFGQTSNFTECSNTSIDACDTGICQCKPTGQICEWNYTGPPCPTSQADVDAEEANGHLKLPAGCLAGFIAPKPNFIDIRQAHNCDQNTAVAGSCGNGLVERNLGEQCDWNMSKNPPTTNDSTVCANVSLKENGCILNSCQCKPNTYHCDWNCQDVGVCDGTVQSIRKVCTPSKDPNCAKPGAYYDANPEGIIPCKNFKGLCGNGKLNTGEDCDYNATSGNYTQGNCIANPDACQNCACTAKPPAPTDNCAQDPGNISLQPIAATRGVLNLQLGWATNNSNCKNYIDHFEILRCTNTSTASCDSTTIDTLSNVINDSVPKNIWKYSDNSRISADKVYCYAVKTVFNGSVADDKTPQLSNMQCKFSGNASCMNNQIPLPDGDCVSGQSADPTIKWGIRQCDENNTIIIKDCSNAQYCAMSSNGNTPQCMDQSACNSCNGLFGFSMFGTYGLTFLDAGTKTNVKCPSLLLKTNSATEEGCFIDYSKSTVDMTYSCINVQSCYDYKSAATCLNDACSAFIDASGNTTCEWVPYGGTFDVFNRGICRPKNTLTPQCDLCKNPSYNRITPECTPSTCALFGKCYGTANNCANPGDIDCTSFTNENDCIGVPGSNNPPQNITVNVTWDASTGKPRMIDGNNAITDYSNDYTAQHHFDYQALGICKWTNNACIRDTNGDNIDDCINRKNSADKHACERDMAIPQTTIRNKKQYAVLMDLSNAVSVTNLGTSTLQNCNKYPACIERSQNNKNLNAAYLYYAIANATAPAAYPQTPLTVSGTGAFLINLSAIPEIQPLRSGQNYTLYYFTESAAHNLEGVKHFTFTLDRDPPEINISFTEKTFRYFNNAPWATNLTVTATLLNDEQSPPVICSIKLEPGTYPGWEIFDLDNTKPMIRRMMTKANDTVNTVYPGLIDSDYNITTTCSDDAGNVYTNTTIITIEANNQITGPSPRGGVYTNLTLPQNISFRTNMTNNTAIECRYSENASKRLFTDMNASKRFYNSSSTDWYLNMSDIIPKVSDSGFYRYFIACNFTGGVIVEDVPGDEIYFALDNLPPITTLINNKTRKEYIANASDNTTNNLTLILRADDLPANFSYQSMSRTNFGVNTTYWCMENASDTMTCNDTIANYAPVTDPIQLDYINDDNGLAAQYGRNPRICYYATDWGNNTAPITCVQTIIKNTLFNSPTIIITEGSR